MVKFHMPLTVWFKDENRKCQKRMTLILKDRLEKKMNLSCKGYAVILLKSTRVKM